MMSQHFLQAKAPPVVRYHVTIAIVGALLVGLGAAGSWDRASNSLLIGAYMMLTTSVGAMVLIALEYLTGAGWSVAFRRVAEALAWPLGLIGCLMVGAVAMRWHAYGWNPPPGQEVGTFWFKQLWLAPTWVIVRAALYVVLWSVLAMALVITSRRQDTVRGIALTERNRRISALTLLLFAPSFTLASVDWFMAIEPLWFSTIWGVYHFAGMIMGTLSVLVLLCLYLRRTGVLRGIFTDHHLHDLGQLLIGFSCFWMYLWFSQYMLIWYSNIPEETAYFAKRVHGAWGPLTLANLAMNWVIPFLVLLPRPSKRSAVTMARVAVLVLVGRWLDLYLMVYPSTTGAAELGLPEIGSLMLCGSALVLLFFHALARAPLVPVGDPFLAESLGATRHVSAACAVGTHGVE